MTGKTKRAKDAKQNRKAAPPASVDGHRPVTMARKPYEKELVRLQRELVKLQEWVRTEGARLVVVFEGRDAAGKGSTIKRVTQYLNPRVARIVGVGACGGGGAAARLVRGEVRPWV